MTRASAALSQVLDSSAVGEDVIGGNRSARPANLIWSLADIMSPRLSGAERTEFFLAVGVGDELEAVEFALRTALRRHIALPASVLAVADGWLAGYAGTATARDLRKLLGRLHGLGGVPSA